ncbi:MAG: response regulator [Novosphingobium sp.]
MGSLSNPATMRQLASVPAVDSTARVLIAEDNEIGLELTCMMARRLGLNVEGAGDGHQALQMLRTALAEDRPFSLVLMDFMMPVVDGIEATRRLRSAGFSAAALPVIALTAVAEPREISRFTAAGGQGYLSKPLSLDKLSAVLEAWLPDDSVNKQPAAAYHNHALENRYAERKRATLARIDLALALCQSDSDSITEIRDLLHKLAGTAGLFGDDALSAAAADFEKDLIAIGSDPALDLIERHQAKLKGAL